MTPAVAKVGCAGYIQCSARKYPTYQPFGGPSGPWSQRRSAMAPAKQKNEKDYDDIPGTYRVRRRALAAGLPSQHVLHVADEGGEPQGVQGRRGEVPRPVSADARAARGDPQARLQPHARARRQHLFHRQARRDRRPSVPASRRADDRLDPAGLCRHDAARRPLGRRQPQQVGQVRAEDAKSSIARKRKPKAASKGKKRRG